MPHQIRKDLKLSLIEYCVADSIYHLSNNPNSKVVGWCWVSKKNLATIFGTTSQTIHTCLRKLINSNIVEKDENTRYLRTTKKWYERVVLIKENEEYQEILHPVKKLNSKQKENFIPTYQETLHNNNKDNNIYNKYDLLLKKWNESQPSPVKDFKPSNIINKHGIEKIIILVDKYGVVNGGFYKFLLALKNNTK